MHKKTNPKIADLEIQFGTTYKEKQFIAQQAKAIKKNSCLVGLFVVILFLILFGYLIYR